MSTSALTWRFRPRLTLRTLSRGDGLLGMTPQGRFGPRGAQVTVAKVDWTYACDQGLHWACPAPASVLHHRPQPAVTVPDECGHAQPLLRDFDAESQALSTLFDTDLRAVPFDALQWRAPHLALEAAAPHETLWSLTQEEHFADFWAEQVPRLQALGWAVIIKPGFAHQSVPVTRWLLHIHADTGEVAGREPLAWATTGPQLDGPLHAPRRTGSWLMTLGVEVDGQTLDLAPLVADLIKRDKRWLDARQVAAIDDAALIRLRAPGGKHIETPAAPLKHLIGHLLDLLADPGRAEGPLPLSEWDALRAAHLCERLAATAPERAGRHGQWQLQGDLGLSKLADRLRHAGAPQRVAAPTGLGITLRPYQLHGLAWLQYLREQHLAGILADDMGLGKTAQTLAHILLEKQAGRLDRPALVIVPTSLLFNWQAEVQRIAPALSVLTLHGTRRRPLMARIPEHDLVLSTYPLVWRDIDTLAAERFHLVVLDEAQTVKNAASRGASAVRRLQTRHRLCLSGTPMENHLGELWAQFDFLLPGFLGDARHFQRHWRDPIERNGETLRAQVLAQRVRPFILRRSKVDVAPELPPITTIVQRLALQGQQKTLYESVRVAADHLVRRALIREGFGASQITVLDALLKLRQVCCDPWLLKGQALSPNTERAKLEWLRETLPALVEQGRRILVFSQFTEMLDLIALELQALSLPYLSLTGDTASSQRADVVKRFQALGEPVMLVSLKAGGVGLNLTAADTIVHVDPWWNPAVQDQATARAHRIGQAQRVTVYQLVAQGSIEERVLALQARKSALANGVLGEDAALAPKFSEADLAMLLAPLESDTGGVSYSTK